MEFQDNNRRHNNNNSENTDHTLNLDRVLSTQPELGPSIPDGGYGWIVFIASLFYQATIPCLIINFGMFLAYSKLETGIDSDEDKSHNMRLWDNNLMKVPLFFCVSQTLFDSLARAIISKSTWPQLVATSGTCLTCAGLVLTWMGMTRHRDQWLFIPAGILIGLGAAFVLAQSEVLLSQYFRLKLNSVHYFAQLVGSCGFVLAPLLIGDNIVKTMNISHILLWYQALVLQGLIVSIFFRKPRYLKSKFAVNRPSYQFIASEADEDEIFSKNSRELQSTRQISTEDDTSRDINRPSTSTTDTSPQTPDDNIRKTWETFGEEDAKYVKLDDWEKFEEEDIIPSSSDGDKKNKKSQSLADELNDLRKNTESQPQSLFSSSDFSPVNNNSSYSYDDEIISTQPRSSGNVNVFVPNSAEGFGILETVKEPTFYKSLLMICTNKFSVFVFYCLFPTYLFLEVNNITLKNLPAIMSCLCLITVAFQMMSPWINVSQANRPLILWIFCWVGTMGYFMISDFKTEAVLVAGAAQVLLSLCTLQHVSKPLYPISIRGEMSREYRVIMVLTGLLLLVFYFVDADFKNLFRMMAIINFFIGALWLSNFIYKRLRAG